MAYTFVVTTSANRIRTYCVQVEAGVGAMQGLEGKVAEWVALKEDVVVLRANSEKAGDGLVRARTVNRVKDSGWDASYTEGSGIAYLLAGKQAKNEPYASVMRVPSRRATSFGHAKATAVGDRVLAEVARTQEPLLSDWAAKFEPANSALKASGQAMEAAEDALDDPRSQRRALIRRLNALIATTEAAILTRYPGRGTLADAILVPNWSRRDSAKNGEDDVSDEGDDVEVDVDDDVAPSET